MADATIVSVGTAGYIDPIRGCPEAPSSPAATDVISTGYTLASNRSRYVSRMYYFSAVTDTNTHEFGITGIKIAFTANASAMGDNDNIAARLTSVAGQITFFAEAAGTAYVLLFIDPIAAGGAIGVGGRAL